MRQRKYHRYDETFRQEALELLRRTDRSLEQVAKDLGICGATLRYWYNASMGKKRRRSPGEALPAGAVETSEQKIARLEREVARLQKKVDEADLDRAILKKAVAFFAKESE